MSGQKIPQSVLVVIHTRDLHVLLLERADHPGYWQSVTGSLDALDEPLLETCRRELFEETGLELASGILRDWQQTHQYEIYPHWRHRYPDGTTHNTEHVFSFELETQRPVTLAPREHLKYQWLPHLEAAERCFSWTNAEAIRRLAEKIN